LRRKAEGLVLIKKKNTKTKGKELNEHTTGPRLDGVTPDQVEKKKFLSKPAQKKDRNCGGAVGEGEFTKTMDTRVCPDPREEGPLKGKKKHIGGRGKEIKRGGVIVPG